GGDTLAGIADDKRHVGALSRALGAKLRVVIDSARHLRPAPETRRVHEHDPSSVDVELGVDRVPRRTRLLVNDHALLPEKGVDERRLANVGPADNREANDVLRLGRRLEDLAAD